VDVKNILNTIKKS